MRRRGYFLIAMLVLAFCTSSHADPAGWQFRTELNGHVCRAVLQGDGIDVQVMRNDLDQLLLIPGSPNWESRAGQTALTLQVDEQVPANLEGMALGKSVFVTVTDGTQRDAIKKAKVLKWHFEWGDFAGNVAGLGDTFDKLGKCD
jgi:hypothetical protein